MTEPKNLDETKNVEDCTGCGYLICLLANDDIMSLTDEQVFEIRAKHECGYCMRKPKEVRKYNPDDTYEGVIYDLDKKQNVKDGSILPLEDRWESISQSRLQGIRGMFHANEKGMSETARQRLEIVLEQERLYKN